MATTRLLSAMVATWNNVATTFTGLKLNVTDTASASGSLLMDLQVGGVSRLTVNKTGRLSGFSGGAVLTNALSANGNIDIPDANFFYWNTRTRMSSGADGAFTIANVAATSSVTFTAGASNLLTLNGGLTTGGSVLIPAANNFAFVGRGGLGATADGVLRLTNSTGTITTDITLSGASGAGASTATFGGDLNSVGTFRAGGSGNNGSFNVNVNGGDITAVKSRLIIGPRTDDLGTNGISLVSTGVAGVLRLQNSGGTNSVDLTVGAASLLTLNGGLKTTGATFALQTATTLTDNAAAQVATMTNGPTAGNPTKWIAINDNGTTRYIPAW